MPQVFEQSLFLFIVEVGSFGFFGPCKHDYWLPYIDLKYVLSNRKSCDYILVFREDCLFENKNRLCSMTCGIDKKTL